MKLRRLDIDHSPGNTILDLVATHRMQHAQMLSPAIKNFNFAVQAVPRIYTLPTVAGPPLFPADEPEIDKFFQDTGLRTWYRASL